jgi:TPR repeat protein
MAAEQGHVDAMNNLGLSCALGSGTAKDPALAAAW